MKLIIAGSRTFNNLGLLRNFLSFLDLPISEIVSGAALGADYLGECWAIENSIDITSFPADWKKLGKSAGPIRNKEMANYADALVCFWDGQSKGSKNMVEQMKTLGKPTYICLYK